MPTYEYVCDACDHKFEEFQSITAPPLRKCPECSRRKLRRLIGGGAGFIFRGSGFYSTDYRSDGYKEAAKKEKEGATGKTEAKSDKKSKAESDKKGSKKDKPKKEAA